MNTSAFKGLMLAGAAASLLLGAGFSTAADDMQPAGQGKVRCEGVNACKGKGDCASGNNCKGSNNCKGQGYLRMSKDECVAARAKLKQSPEDPFSEL
ncbi:MAG: hypothetical protein O2845_02410 [Proteobacteria bacterium]|nr:hypothetical protein [Pseudomonadota bacterium]